MYSIWLRCSSFNISTVSRDKHRLGYKTCTPTPSGKQRQKIEIITMLTVFCSSPRVFCLGLVQSVWTDPHQDQKSQRRGPDQTKLPLLQMACNVHTIPFHSTKYPCPVCTHNVTIRGGRYQCNRCFGWVHTKYSGLVNAAQYRRSNYWVCDSCSVSLTQQSPSASLFVHLLPLLHLTYKLILQLNVNGIGNKLKELGVVLENTKVKVAVIQG